MTVVSGLRNRGQEDRAGRRTKQDKGESRCQKKRNKGGNVEEGMRPVEPLTKNISKLENESRADRKLAQCA